MKVSEIDARFDEFALPETTAMDATVVVPTVKANWKLKYGEHAYYFMNLRASKGLRVRIGHLDIIRPGLDRFRRALAEDGRQPSMLHCFFRKYHYDFSFLEQVMLMTVPHTVTQIGEGRYIINLWSYCGYVLVDCNTKQVTYHTLDEADGVHVLGSGQWHDRGTGELYAMTYSLADSFRRIVDPSQPVSCRIFAHRIGSSENRKVWQGQMADYMHDIIMSPDRRYVVVCELGMYLNEKDEMIPSKALIVDLQTGRDWTLDRFNVAAHARFDPEDSTVVYFSNHNFQFEHSSLVKLLKQATYTVKFRGPATVYKYRLTPEGPQEIGSFTSPDFFRLTNMHVFHHRGRKVMAAMGFPDVIFLVDANSMTFIRKVQAKEPHSKQPATIGTMVPSPDGEKLFVQTTRTFQVIDIDSGQADYIRDCGAHHTGSNHMIATGDTSWR